MVVLISHRGFLRFFKRKKMSHPRAGGAVTTRTKIRTPGPQMGNMTIDAYQVPRDTNRLRGGTEYYPGKADMYTMRIDEHEICLAFRDLRGIMPTGTDSDVYRGHLGTAVFTNLVGLRSKFWIQDNCYVVGVAKSHTTLDDRAKKEYSQLAVFIGGTTSVVNNGLYSIPAGSEVRVRFYDRIHDPVDYERLFMKSDVMDGDYSRPLAVVEPHHRADNIVQSLQKFLPFIQGTAEGEDDSGILGGFSRLEWENRNSFYAIMKRLHGSIVDLMVFGALAFNAFSTDLGGKANYSASLFRNKLMATDMAVYKNFRTALSSINTVDAGANRDFGVMLTNMLYNTGRGYSARGDSETYGTLVGAPKERLDFVSNLQKGVRNALHNQADMVKWDRKTVIGTALETSNPGERLNINLKLA